MKDAQSRGSVQAALGLVLASSGAFTAALGGEPPQRVPPPWKRFGGYTTDGYALVELVPGSTVASSLLLQEFDVVSVEPVFRDGPMVHRSPASFHALGFDRMYFVVFARRQGDLERRLEGLRRLRSVEKAWADQVVEFASVPNDPDYPSQYHLNAGHINCEAMWDLVTSSKTLVGIVDSGADLVHRDLSANLWRNPGEIPRNGIDDDGNGFIDDINGYDFLDDDSDPMDEDWHGTMVAGTLGAVGDNSLDVTGVLWSVPMIIARSFGNGRGTSSTVAAGMIYVADQGVGVTNMSFGFFSKDPVLNAAVQYAASLDVVQVAAAGNAGDSAPFYPAAYPECISVMATDASNNRTSWSDYGDWCDLAAPGDSIRTLKLGGGTDIGFGTSFASPQVCAIAAMLREVNPEMDRTDVALAVFQSATDLGGVGKDATFQWGLLNARGAHDRGAALHISTTTVAPGGSVDLDLSFPRRPGDIAILLPTFSGREPGIDLDQYLPGDYRFVPINFDTLSQWSLLFPNVGVFVNFISTLDAAGASRATLSVPKGPLFAGQTVNFAAVTIDPLDLGSVQEISGSVGLSIR